MFYSNNICGVHDDLNYWLFLLGSQCQAMLRFLLSTYCETVHIVANCYDSHVDCKTVCCLLSTDVMLSTRLSIRPVPYVHSLVSSFHTQ